MRLLSILITLALAMPAAALELSAPFESIDGGTLRLSDYAGHPVLVVNTASRCGFTGQYEGLQTLYDRYHDRGLVVVAVPSDDFRQELGTAAEVKEFCALNYNITLPMTGITHVTGTQAHPFYRSVKAEAGFTPNWNFTKILLGPDGKIVATYGSTARPLSGPITRQIEALLQ